MLFSKKLLIYLAVIFIFGAIFLNGALFPAKNEIIFGGDLLTQFYYWKGFLKENIGKGVIPFWNPYNFSGTPFLAHPGTAVFYPLTAIFLLLPLNMAFSLNYYLHLVIGGTGAFFLTLRYAGYFTSLISALAFMYSGYFAARIYAGHVDLLTTAVWIPWVINSFLQVSENPNLRKNLILAIVSLSLLILAGYNAYLVFVLEFIFLFSLYLLIKKPSRIARIFPTFFLVIAVSIGLTSTQWLPTWQLTKNSIRGQGLPYQLASWGSLPFSGLKLFYNPLDHRELDKISFNLGGGPKANPFDHFPGRISLLIILGYITYFLLSRFFTGKKRSSINSDFWFFLFLSIFFLWISLGNNVKPGLHYFLYNLVPFYRYIRIPIQNLIIPVVLIPVMLGMILNKVKSYLLQIVLCLFIVGELFIFGREYIFLTILPVQKHNKSIISQINKISGTGRLLPAFRVISSILDRFDLNASMLYRFESISGYDPLILKNYYDFIDSSNGNKISSLPLYNVEIPPIDLNKKTSLLLNVSRILNEDGSLTENKNYLPRFNFSQDNQCLDKNNKISIIEYSINKIILSSSNDCDAQLLSSEVYYPGWQAKIDGKKTPVSSSNLAFRTVFLPAGKHIIEYYYYPYIYIYGLIISIITLISAVIVLKKFYE